MLNVTDAPDAPTAIQLSNNEGFEELKEKSNRRISLCC